MISATAGCNDPKPHDGRSPIQYSLVEAGSVGTLDGADHETFGFIQGIAAAPDGSFFVFDAQARAVHWYDSAGAHRGSVRSAGRGPGELASPVGIGLTEPDRLAIVDPGNAAISLYSFGAGGLEFVGSVPMHMWLIGQARPVCGWADRVFVRGTRGGKVIHALDMAGEESGAFGGIVPASAERYGPNASLVEARFNAGFLLCLADRDAVVSFARHGTAVEMLRGDGATVWRTDLADVRPMDYAASGRSLVAEYHPDGSHLGLSLVRWDSAHLLVQHLAVGPDDASGSDGSGNSTIMSRFLSVEDGRQVATTVELPWILDSVDGTYFSVEATPVPRVRILKTGS